MCVLERSGPRASTRPGAKDPNHPAQPRTSGSARILQSRDRAIHREQESLDETRRSRSQLTRSKKLMKTSKKAASSKGPKKRGPKSTPPPAHVAERRADAGDAFF